MVTTGKPPCTPGSKRRVFWRCANGHSWQAAVHTRSGSGTGCPYCSGRFPIPGENDLATKYPLLAQEWNTEKNGDLTPRDVLPGSHRIVWWRCAHGHQWRAQIKSRVNGSGCPVCTNRTVQSGDNDLATQLPDLAKEWHPTQNGALTPKDVVPGSRRKVWWICPKGHEYQAMISSRAQGSGCPVCAGKKIIPGENDLAITSEVKADGFVFTPLFRQRLVVIVHEGHPFASRSSISVSELADMPVYTYREDIIVGTEVSEFLESHGLDLVKMNLNRDSDDEVILGGIVSRAPVVGLALDSSGLYPFRNLKLIPLEEPEAQAIHPIGVLRLAGKRFNPATNDFIEFLFGFARNFYHYDDPENANLTSPVVCC